MIRVLGLRLDLAPVPAARARTGQGRTYTPTTYRTWKASAVDRLRRAWAGRPRLELPVVVGLAAVFERPARAPRRYSVRGVELEYPFPWEPDRRPFLGPADLDNLEKAALDALVQSGILLDDRLVYASRGVEKVYAAVDEAPCVELRLWSPVVPAASPDGLALRATPGRNPGRGSAVG